MLYLFGGVQPGGHPDVFAETYLVMDTADALLACLQHAQHAAAFPPQRSPPPTQQEPEQSQREPEQSQACEKQQEGEEAVIHAAAAGGSADAAEALSRCLALCLKVIAFLHICGYHIFAHESCRNKGSR